MSGASRPRLGPLFEDQSQVIIAPGAYDALMARLIEASGFQALHITGGGISRSLGFPDVGALTMTEMLDRIGYITDSVNIPVIADADTGYGTAYNLQRTVRELERRGVASFHIEDEVYPKKCMLLQARGLKMEFASVLEMEDRMRACTDARTDPSMLLVARVGMRLAADISAVVEACQRYVEAGADALFMVRLSKEELRQVCKAVSVPVMFNIAYVGNSFGRFPDGLLSAADLQEVGCSVAIVSAGAAVGGLLGMKKALDWLKTHGEVGSYYEREADAQEMADFYLLNGVEEVQRTETRYQC